MRKRRDSRLVEDPEARSRAAGQKCRRARGWGQKGLWLPAGFGGQPPTKVCEPKKEEEMTKLGMLFLGIFMVTVVAMCIPAHAGQDTDSKTKPAGELLVDINTASAEDLAQLPGVGDKVAERIVNYREKNGRFQKVEEIMNVRGIGEKTFVKLRDHLVVKSGSKKSSSSKKKS